MEITSNAADKVAGMKSGDEHLRVYITGGGCSGFNYGFILDEKIIDGDYIHKKNDMELRIDPMSFQYLDGITIDYIEDLQGSRFHVTNPQAKTTRGCGSSFSV